jgi:hypothetical protein
MGLTSFLSIRYSVQLSMYVELILQGIVTLAPFLT